MFEKPVITPLGRTLLQRKQKQLEKVILKSQEGLVEINQSDPGDGFQDGFVLDTQMNLQMMEQQLQLLTELLRDSCEAEKPPHNDAVTLGHRIRLNLNYPTGESETLTVVLIPTHELALVDGQLRKGELPVSPNSALGAAIVGCPRGATFQYEINDGIVQGKILQIDLWPRAFELAA